MEKTTITKTEQKRLSGAIEAILFAMGDSVELKKLAQAIEQDEDTTKALIRQMMERYQKETGEFVLWNWNLLIRCVRKRSCMNI